MKSNPGELSGVEGSAITRPIRGATERSRGMGQLRRPSAEGSSPGSVPPWPVPESERYLVSSEHAVGGLGRILEASDRRLDRRVAIKELLQGGADAEARFVREALITARLQHPSIIPIYDLTEDATGKPFYAMKMISGRSLDAIAREKTKLEERYALIPHVSAVADAMAYAHQQGIVHRDLKPANIMIGAFGETFVIDWGLAADLRTRVFSRQPSSTYEVVACGLTVQGTVLGTPEFMPPEQARGDSVDERADVYALGAILYYVMAGAPPYQGKTSKEILFQIRLREPVPLRRRQPGIATELAAIVDKAMARDPAQRYGSAQQMAEDLKRFQTGQLVGAHRYSVSLRIWRWAKRYRLALGVAVLSLLALAATGIVSARRIVRERNYAEQQWRLAENRRDELILAQATSSLDRDPTEALAWLKAYPVKANTWQRAREISADAVSRGIARHVFRHGSELTDIAISRDGSRFASAGKDKTIRIWDTASGKEEEALRQGTGGVNTLAFSPQGQLLAWAGQDKKVWLWAVNDQPPRLLGAHDSPVYQLAFSPDGSEIASVGFDGTVRLWDVAGTGNRVLVGHQGAIYVVRYSPNGKLLATAGADHTVRIWDRATGAGRILHGHTGEVYALAFSDDGKLLSSAGKDGSIRMWNVNTGKSRTLIGHQGIVSDLAFSADSKTLASSGFDKTVRLWDLPSGSSRVFSGHQGEVELVRYSPDGQFLISASRDKTARIWHIQSGDSRTLHGHTRTVLRAGYLPDGVHLLTASTDGTARLWDTSLNASQPLQGHADGIYHVAFSPDGRYLAADSREKMARLWDLVTGEKRVLRGHTNVVYGLAFSRDGKTLATSSFDGTVRVWDTLTGDSRVLRGHGDRVQDAVFLPNGQSVASASSDGAVRLWSLGRAESEILHMHHGGATAVAVSPNGRFVASAGNDGRLRIWDASRQRSLELGSDERVFQINFSPDSRWMIAASHNVLQLWETTSSEAPGHEDNVSSVVDSTGGQLFRSAGFDKLFRGHEGKVSSVVVSSDGQHFASAGVDKTVRVWSVHSGEVHVFRGHEGAVRSVAFAPDGKTVASGSEDRTVRIWDVNAGVSRILRGHRNFVTSVAYSPSGNMLVSAGLDGEVRLWPVQPGANPPTSLSEFHQWLNFLTSGEKDVSNE